MWKLAIYFELVLVSMDRAVCVPMMDGLEVAVGQSLEMDCSAANMGDQYGITWEKADNPPKEICFRPPSSTACGSSSHDRYKPAGKVGYVDANTIRIYNVQTDESGSYRCKDFIASAVKKSYQHIQILATPTVVPSIDEPSTFRLGSTARFTCKLASEPPGTFAFLWYRNNAHLQKSSSNIWTKANIQVEDEGSYKCRVGNAGGDGPWSPPVSLLVIYGPTSGPSIKGHIRNETKNVYNGDQLSLMCEISGGNPLANLTWSCAGLTGQQRHEGPKTVSDLTGELTAAMNGKDCKCTASHFAWTDSNRPGGYGIRLNVYYPPSQPTQSPVPALPWLENRSYNMDCVVPNKGNNECSYRWYKDSQLVEGQTDSRLPLEVTKDDSGKEVRCQLKNEYLSAKGGDYHASQTLNVEYVPRVSINPSTGTIKKENDTVMWTCLADSNPPADPGRHFRWTFGPSSVGRGNKAVLQRGPLTKYDSGQYTCTVTVQSYGPHGPLQGSSSVTLTVQYLHLTETSAATTVTEGEPLDIWCRAEGVPAWTFSRWLHTGRYVGTRLVGEETIEQETRYNVEIVNYTHTGEYTCFARHSVDAKAATIPVAVRFVPKNLTHRAEGEVIVTETGKNLPLELTVFAYPEQVNFTWFMQSRNGSSHTKITEDVKRFQIKSSYDGLVSTLIIQNVSIEELTNYTATAENGVLGGSHFKFIVRPQGCPWKVSVGNTKKTAASLAVTWRPGFNSGLLQTITVKLSNITLDISDQCEDGEERARHVRPEYDVPIVTDMLGLLDATCYRVVIEAHNDYNKNNDGKGCTERVIIEGPDMCTKVKPTVLQGEFIVVYMAKSAFLTWSRPSNNNYDRQVVEQWQVASRGRRQVETCDTSHLSNSFVVPMEQTSLTVGIDPQMKYTFKLVLYDGHVQVSSFVASLDDGPLSEKCQYPYTTGAMIGAFLGGALFGAFVLVLIILLLVHQKYILFQRKDKGKNYQKGNAASKMYEDVKDPSDEITNREAGATYSELGTNRDQHEYASLGTTLNTKDAIGTKQRQRSKKENKNKEGEYNNVCAQNADHDNKEYSELSFANDEYPYMDIQNKEKTIESRT